MSVAVSRRLSLGLVVALSIIGLFRGSVCAEPPAQGRIEITALLRGESVSARCKGVAINPNTFRLAELRLANGVLTAEVPPED